MLCPKCKKEISPDSKFCEYCGARIDAQPYGENTATPIENPIEQPLETAEQPSQPQATPIVDEVSSDYGENPYFTPSEYFPVDNPTPDEKPKKKKNKKVAIIVSVIVAIVVILVAALFSWQYIAKASAGNISYYLWRESKTAEKLINTEAIDDAFDIDDFTVSADFDSDEEGDDLKNSVKASYDDDKKQFVGTYKMSDGDTDLTYKLCYGDNKVSLSVPSGYISSFLGGNSDTKNEVYYLDISEILGKDDLLNNTVDASDILEILKATEKEALDKKNVSTKIGTVNGSVCNTTTITLTQSEAANLVAELWSQAQDNKHIKETFDNALKAAYDTKMIEGYDTLDSFKDEFYKSIDNGIKNMQENADDDSVIEFSVSTSLFGNVVSRSVNIYYDGDLTEQVVINSKSNGLEISYSDDNNNSLNIDYTANVTSKQINGEVTVKSESDGKTDFDLSVKFEEIGCEKVGGVDVITGKITVDGNDSDDKFNGTIEAKADDKYTLAVDFKSGDEELFKGDAQFTLSDKADMSNYEKPSSENAKSFGELFGTSEYAKDNDVTDDYDFDYDYDLGDGSSGDENYNFDGDTIDMSGLEDYTDPSTDNTLSFYGMSLKVK